MKTYQSKTKESRKNFFKRHKYAIAITISSLVIIAAIVLTVVFTLPQKQPIVDTPTPDDPTPPITDVGTEPSMYAPMSGATLGLDYADDRLVKWDTLELWKWHPAMDFVGEGDVVAVLDGTVTDIEKTALDGNVVTITHDNGYVSIYKSLAADMPIKVGDTVKAGDKIGSTSTSMMSELNTGAHLHFELKKDGKYVNPASVLPISEDK
ncbi:MAG: M23 family metallopeptidase [Clostridiales bacterium]|nr:M23 family metallopeptidase [Clostridiales bacterium]